MVNQRRLGSRHQPEQTRAAILDAAAHEFAQEGVTGARIAAIARHARVNKALLYYYFHNKETLYGAVLDRVFAQLRDTLLQALAQELPPREKMLAYVGAHFDFVASATVYPRLAQREMMRAGRQGSPHLPRLVENYFRPVFLQVAGLIQQGIAAGEFRPVDPAQFLTSVIAVIVFYFSATPVLQLLTGGDPLAPARVAARRAAVLDFLQASLFRGTPSRRRTSHRAALTRAAALSASGALVSADAVSRERKTRPLSPPGGAA